jgi:ubiquinone/menaquinone biosynthesis C-methylase UbiE
MLKKAREYTESLGIVNCEYVQRFAENLDFLQEESVDLVTAGEQALALLCSS